MPLLHPSGRPITRGEVARARANALTGAGLGDRGFGEVYEGARAHGAWFSDWPTSLQSADREFLPARRGIVGRTRDLVRNDPVAASALGRRKNAAVGKGWRFSSKPAARALGITTAQAAELGQAIETEWKLYAYGHNFSPDAERKLTFGQLLRLAASHLMMDGEFLGLVEFAADEPTRYATRLRMVDPDRLSNPVGRMDDDFLHGGVQHNAASIPIGYWIRQRHEADIGLSVRSFSWSYWDRFSTPLGRPQVLHGFDPDRAGQTRGVTRFAAALKSFRALSRFTDATLQAATINALIVGFMKSSAGPEALSETFGVADLVKFEQDREEFYDEHPVMLGDARMPALPLGDEMKLATASKDVTSFDAFVRAIIRLIAASLGVTYEELSMDYSQTNYSSARAAGLHAWADTLAFMGVLESQCAKPFFVAWLEEAFDCGFIEAPEGAPDFYDAPDAYAEGKWIGPGRGYVDPTKEILAAAARIEANISTLEDEAAEQGKDWEEVLEQAAREQARMRELGIVPNLAQAAQDAKSPFRTAPSPSNAEGQPASEDARPSDPKQGGASALHLIASFAETADHAAFLDARPV